MMHPYRLEKHLRRALCEQLTNCHWQPIEAGQVGGGIPDLNGCFQGVEIWLELKIQKGNIIGVTPRQATWLMRRAEAGGRCFVLAANPTHLALYKGADARKLQNREEVTPLATFSYPIDWGGLYRKLFYGDD